MFFMTNDQERIDKVLASETGERSIAGSNEHIIDQLGHYVEQGFDEIIVPDFTLGGTAQERLDNYETFTNDIVSQFS